jgi:hypothetical protein
MDRILRNTAGRIALTLSDQEGSPLSASAVDVSVADATGAEVITSAAVTDVDGVWGLELTPEQTASLGPYTATWVATVDGVVNTYTTHFEVVGGFLFTIAEARAFDDGALADAATYPTAALVEGRAYVENYLEHLCGVSFVPRARRLVVDGSDLNYIRIPDLYARRVVSATHDGDDVAVDVAVYPRLGRVYRVNGYWSAGEPGNVVLVYEHGYEEPPPAVTRAALLLLKDKVIGSNVDARALTFSDDLGTRSLAVPGRSGPTGLPEVDAVIAQYSERLAVLY